MDDDNKALLILLFIPLVLLCILITPEIYNNKNMHNTQEYKNGYNDYPDSTKYDKIDRSNSIEIDGILPNYDLYNYKKGFEDAMRDDILKQDKSKELRKDV